MYIKVKHVQGVGITSLYLANTRRGEVLGKVRGHGLVVGRGEKPIPRFLLKLFWVKCLAGMTYRPKEVKVSGNHQVHAMRDREREHPYCSR